MGDWNDGPSADRERRTLLVVDDEESIRLMLEDILGVRYRVLTATDGLDALKVLESGEDHIDLVITDLRMPRMDGHDLATTLLSDYPHLGIFVITAHGTIDTAVEALQGGIHDYITKPLPANFSEILRQVRAFFPDARPADGAGNDAAPASGALLFSALQPPPGMSRLVDRRRCNVVPRQTTARPAYSATRRDSQKEKVRAVCPWDPWPNSFRWILSTS